VTTPLDGQYRRLRTVTSIVNCAADATEFHAA
jgi:hypothetical protein